MRICYIDPTIKSFHCRYHYYWFMADACKNLFNCDIRYDLNKLDEYKWIILGFGCFNELSFLQNFRCNSNIIIILNKEYTNLEQKLDIISRIKPQYCFTAYYAIEKLLPLKFQRLSFATSINEFINNFDGKYIYDIGFTGIIRHEQDNNIRRRIINLLNKQTDITVYYRENTGLPLDKYKQLTQQTKIWLCTTGPADLVGTRYFEIMAMRRSLVLCNNKKHVYDNIFEDKVHCVMFNDELDFIEKLRYYLINDNERKKIIDNAYFHVIKNHDWSNRAQQIIKCII